jgi:glycerol dehydrogenase
MPFTVRPADVVSALRSIEGFATRVRAEAGLPAPVKYIARH